MCLETGLMESERMKKDQLENFSANQGGDNGDFNLGSISEVEIKGRDWDIMRK